jgi:hypothetical protein
MNGSRADFGEVDTVPYFVSGRYFWEKRGMVTFLDKARLEGHMRGSFDVFRWEEGRQEDIRVSVLSFGKRMSESKEVKEIEDTDVEAVFIAIVSRLRKAPENPSPRGLDDLVFGIAKDVAILSSHILLYRVFFEAGETRT